MVIEGVRREVEMADYRLLDLLGGRVAVQIEQSQGQLFAAPVDTNVNCVIHKLCHRYASSQGVDYCLPICCLSSNTLLLLYTMIYAPVKCFWWKFFTGRENSLSRKDQRATLLDTWHVLYSPRKRIRSCLDAGT